MKNREQLEYIERMIASAKVNMAESSIFYLIWGWLAVLAAIIQLYVLNYTAYYSISWLSWPVLMSTAGIISWVVARKKNSKKRFKTQVESFMVYLWMGIIVTLVLVLLMMVKIQASGAYPIVILLYGLGTFVSGSVLKFKPLILGGIACWLLGYLAIYSDFNTQILLIIVALVLSYIVPGHILSAQQKKNV